MVVCLFVCFFLSFHSHAAQTAPSAPSAPEAILLLVLLLHWLALLLLVPKYASSGPDVPDPQVDASVPRDLRSLAKVWANRECSRILGPHQ